MALVFPFSRRARRRRLLADPVPAHWHAVLDEFVPALGRLSGSQRALVIDLARVMLAEKRWTPAGGLVLTDEMKLVIAAQASLLLAGSGLDPARDPVLAPVREIIVYPAGFVNPISMPGPAGIISAASARLGEAWQRGPVIVSWQDARRGGADPADGRNLVLHEFAHVLDNLDGIIDGTPPLHAREDYARWRAVMTESFERLRAARAQGIPTLLDPYGATNPGEFFAVATECFFERGADLAAREPALYDALRSYYRLDPASW